MFGLCATATALWLVIAWVGRTPPLRNSITLQLEEEPRLDLQELELRLRATTGVYDVTVLPADRVAYIKVDDEHFESTQVYALRGVLPAS